MLAADFYTCCYTQMAHLFYTCISIICKKLTADSASYIHAVSLYIQGNEDAAFPGAVTQWIF